MYIYIYIQTPLNVAPYNPRRTGAAHPRQHIIYNCAYAPPLPTEHNVKNATKAVSAGGQAVTAANQAVEKGGGTKPMTEAASAGETAARGVVVSGTVTSGGYITP